MNNTLLCLLNNVRFELKGQMLTSEDAASLPLQAKNGFDLDNLYKVIKKQLKETEEESIVSTTTKENKRLKAMLEFVVEVIEHKKSVASAKVKRAKDKVMRDQVKGILAQKQHQSLLEKSEEDLLKMLEDSDTDEFELF